MALAPGASRESKTLNDPATIEHLMRGNGTWAVVGLSQNRARDAYGVASLLQRTGKRIVAIHPRADKVHGEPGYPSLDDVPDGVRIDVVDCFVNATRVGGVVDDALRNRERLGITAIWMQLRVIDHAAAERALAAGLDVVQDRCPAIEARRLQLGAN